MGFLDNIWNLDAELMAASSRAWAANEVRKAERRCSSSSSSKEENKDEEKKKVEEMSSITSAVSDDNDPVVIEQPQKPTVINNVIVDPLRVSENEQVQGAPDFSVLQNASVPLEPGVKFETQPMEINNPALAELEREKLLNEEINKACQKLVENEKSLGIIDQTTMATMMRAIIDKTIATIRKDNPNLTAITPEMMNAGMMEVAKSINS